MEDKRLKKIYNPNNISALARHLGVTNACVHNWKNGEVSERDMLILDLIIKGLGINKRKSKKLKGKLILDGWTVLCAEKTA